MIGAVPHRADDHHHLVALLLGANGLAGRGQNLLTIGNAGAAEFLNDQWAWCWSVVQIEWSVVDVQAAAETAAFSLSAQKIPHQLPAFVEGQLRLAGGISS